MVARMSKIFFLPFVCLWLLTACATPSDTTGQPASTPAPSTTSANPTNSTVITTSTNITTPGRSTSTSQVTWLITKTALDRLQAAGMQPSVLKRWFDNTHTYVIGQMPAGWQSISTLSFTSYASLKKAFDSGTIPASVRAILYDNEAWAFTPKEEQLHFSTYVREVADLVHNHQKLLIATPAVDLVSVLDPHGQGDTYTRFLSLGLLGDAARFADLVEVQAQSSEANLAKYTQFVDRASAQARAARVTVTVLAGLSTNPGGQKVTGQQLTAAFQATHNQVSGYWLNIPGNEGGYCPACGTPQPQVAIDFLQSIS